MLYYLIQCTPFWKSMLWKTLKYDEKSYEDIHAMLGAKNSGLEDYLRI